MLGPASRLQPCRNDAGAFSAASVEYEDGCPYCTMILYGWKSGRW
jgi:hypothetical protein